jgi:NhaP-type Na+/H+ and K+/H+ antiporter
MACPLRSGRREEGFVGWVELFAKPIIFAVRQMMGIAALHPFDVLICVTASLSVVM